MLNKIATLKSIKCKAVGPLYYDNGAETFMRDVRLTLDRFLSLLLKHSY